MRFTSPTALLAAVLFASAAVAMPAEDAATGNTDNSTGKALYITAPACSFYQCTVPWYQGNTVNVNWLASPAGSVSVTLVSHDGGSDYVIAAAAPGTTKTCDAGGGVGVTVPDVTCGNAEFVVPSGWAIGSNYSIQVASLSSPTVIGYTDLIAVIAANSTGPVAPTGTTVSLIGATSSPTSASVATTASAATATGSSAGSTTAPSSTTAPASTSRAASTTSSAAPTTTTKASAGALLQAGGSASWIGAFVGLFILI